VESELSVRKSLLRRYPAVTIRTDWEDPHLYLISQCVPPAAAAVVAMSRLTQPSACSWVLDLLDANTRISSVQGDLVHYLVNLQFSGDEHCARLPACPPARLPACPPARRAQLAHARVYTAGTRVASAAKVQQLALSMCHSELANVRDAPRLRRWARLTA
jgi:hypothetical protein